MIADEFYCPCCGELWDGLMCLECGFEDEEVGKPKARRKENDGYFDKLQDKNKDRRIPKERTE